MFPRMVCVTAAVILLFTGMPGCKAGASQMTDNWGSGWMLLNSTYYYLSLEAANWSSALTSCKEKGADLLSLESWTEQSQKLSKMKFAAYERIWWIGLQNSSSVSKWVSLYDNSSFSGEIILWNEGEPNNEQGQEDCVEMYPMGELNDVPCEPQQSYICKKYLKLVNGSRNSCDNNWILILDSCYYLSTTPAVQWTDAQRNCNELGANLLTLESLDEVIRRKTWRFTSIDRWWVGLRRVPSSGKWQWIKKPPILSPAVTQWKKDVLNTEDCVVMDSDGFLSDMSCNSSRYFICVKSMEDADNCDSGWIKIFSMCYKLSNKALSWSGAQESCKTEGGKLLVVRTLIELVKILENINLTSSPWWVGLKRASPSNFDLKQDDGSKECGMIASDNFLAFEDCKALHSYICQKNHSEDKQSEGKPILSVIIGAVVGSVVAVAVIVVIVIVVIRRRRADPTYASPKSRPAPGEEHEYMDLSDTAGQPNRTADSEQRKQEEGAYEVPVFPPS